MILLMVTYERHFNMVLIQAQNDHLFGDSFQAAPSSAPVFSSSAFQAAAPSSAPDMFGASPFQLAPPAPAPQAYQQPAAPPSNFGGDSFQAYGAGTSNGHATGNVTNGNMFVPSQSFSSFESTPSSTTGGGGGFAQTPSMPQGQAFSNNQTYGINQSFMNNQTYIGHQSQSGNPSTMGAQQVSSSNNAGSQPQQSKKSFSPVKSALWADTLSTGLVDLNIAGRMFHSYYTYFLFTTSMRSWWLESFETVVDCYHLDFEKKQNCT